MAEWREALLAQKVLAGGAIGYRHHPQLIRFQSQPDSLAAIATFLEGLADEARARGYKFNAGKISERRMRGRIVETKGQLLFEWKHLRAKLRARSPEIARRIRGLTQPDPHPLFRIVSGPVRSWEKR